MNLSPYKVVLLGDLNEDACPVFETAMSNLPVRMEAAE